MVEEEGNISPFLKRSDEKTLFHYCSPATFHAIVSNKSFWLSSVFMSNDAKEGAVVPETLARMARKDGLPDFSVSRLEDELQRVASLVDGLAFCLSTNGDLLSQWRGYAADATGFALGFNSSRLKALCDIGWKEELRMTSLQEVIYDPDAQEHALASVYSELKKELEAEIASLQNVRQSAFERLASPPGNVTTSYFEQLAEAVAAPSPNGQAGRSELSKKAGRVLLSLFRLKNAAFEEEREFRVLELHFRGDPASYRPASGKIVPYKSVDLSKELTGCLTNVVIGPKNSTPSWVVENFLSSAGFENVTVTASAATYR